MYAGAGLIPDVQSIGLGDGGQQLRNGCVVGELREGVVHLSSPGGGGQPVKGSG